MDFKDIRNILKIKLLTENAVVPTVGSKNAAGLDLYAYIEEGDIIVEPFTTVKINTGIAVEIPDGYFGGVYARSGLATKQGLRPSNCVGVIDSDYRGEVMVALYNDSDKPRAVVNGDRIAQLIIQPYLNAEIDIVDELSETDRGNGGFGSTGV